MNNIKKNLNPMGFNDLKYWRDTDIGNRQAIARFDNGYEASVVTGIHTYGGAEGLYEIAVMRSGRVVYDTPVTDDVIGWLNEDGVSEILTQIRNLPRYETND